MTKLLEQALEAVRQMPAADQDNIASAMLSMAKIGDALDVDPEHWAEVLETLAHGRPASPQEVEAALRSFDR